MIYDIILLIALVSIVNNVSLRTELHEKDIIISDLKQQIKHPRLNATEWE